MNRPRCSAGTAAAERYTVATIKIPAAFDGFKIAHISDPHSRPAKGVLEIITDAKPDITVITGDLLHDDDKPYDEITELLSGLLKVSPVYIVTGNHDVWRTENERIFREFENMGSQVLDNKMTELEKNGEKIALYGVGDPFSRIPAVISAKVESAFSALPDYDGYKILLFHRANLFDEIKDYGYDLILSGHMHGGQMRVPKIGGILAPSSALLSRNRMLFPNYCCGTFSHKNTSMIVNRGIGNTLPLPRWGNRAEVGLVTLERI